MRVRMRLCARVRARGCAGRVWHTCDLPCGLRCGHPSNHLHGRFAFLVDVGVEHDQQGLLGGRRLDGVRGHPAPTLLAFLVVAAVPARARWASSGARGGLRVCHSHQRLDIGRATNVPVIDRHGDAELLARAEALHANPSSGDLHLHHNMYGTQHVGHSKWPHGHAMPSQSGGRTHLIRCPIVVLLARNLRLDRGARTASLQQQPANSDTRKLENQRGRAALPRKATQGVF